MNAYVPLTTYVSVFFNPLTQLGSWNSTAVASLVSQLRDSSSPSSSSPTDVNINSPQILTALLQLVVVSVALESSTPLSDRLCVVFFDSLLVLSMPLSTPR